MFGLSADQFYAHMMLLKRKWSSYIDYSHKTSPATSNLKANPDGHILSSLSKYGFKIVSREHAL